MVNVVGNLVKIAISLLKKLGSVPQILDLPIKLHLFDIISTTVFLYLHWHIGFPS